MEKNEGIVVNLNNKSDNSNRDNSVANNTAQKGSQTGEKSNLELEILKELERQERLAQEKIAKQTASNQPQTSTAQTSNVTKKVISASAQQKIQASRQQPSETNSTEHIPLQKIDAEEQQTQPETNFTKDKLNQRVSTSQQKSKEVINSSATQKPKLDEKQQAEKRYADFMKQYSKKEEIVDVSSTGKYDSDLDFQLNKKIKKVRFPMPKYAKWLISALAIVFCTAIGIVLGFTLNKDIPEALLTNITMSQPQSGNCYVVNNVYVGDKLNCNNIYLTCQYSDGSSKEVELTRSMISLATTKINGNDTFIEKGDALVHVKYMDKILNLKYVVQEKTLESISVFTPTLSSTYDLVVSAGNVNLSNSVVVNATFSNGITQRIDLNDCSYKYAGMQSEIKISNGKIDFSGLNDGQIYEVEISYQSYTANFKVLINN